MSLDVVRGTTNKPAASQTLAQALSEVEGLSGNLLIGYPIISTSRGRHLVDAVLVSQDRGIVVFDLVEGEALGDYRDRQDDAANLLHARLATHPDLMRRRRLRIPIATVTFAPAVPRLPPQTDEPDYILANQTSFVKEFGKLRWDSPNNDVYRTALSAIESVSSIRTSRTKRLATRPNSRGSKLKTLEDSIATLDHRQRKAVIETVEGVQRIRGLAGSGKTIILALKAAYLHAQHPDWRIGVTFNTRSLKGQFRRLIERFCFDQIGDDPDWRSLRILNAWGAPGGPERDGIYHEFCQLHGLDYLDFGRASKKHGWSEAFTGACTEALAGMSEHQAVYDALLVDEAQDFSPSFLKLCYTMLREPRRLVYAYDELQSLSGESLPPPTQIFGGLLDGRKGSDRDEQDIILDKCYRNSRPVLVAAHALGFGVYRNPDRLDEPGLVQMFDHEQLWEEIGYRVVDGELRAGSKVTLGRTPDTSPRFLEEHSDPEDLVQFVRFATVREQDLWLADAVQQNVEEDELRRSDIVVINPDPLKTRKAVGSMRAELLRRGIQCHLAGVDTPADTFFSDDADSVTFTGVHRAKGNEAAMVYVVNAQDCATGRERLASLRNMLFTAMTRSKAWLRVVGVGSGMGELLREYGEIKQRNYELAFTYPTPAERDHLRIIHRDMTDAQRSRLEQRRRSIDALIEDLGTGKVHAEDFDDGRVRRLLNLLNERARE